MILHSGLSYDEKRALWKTWQPWFAWYPVKSINDRDWLWLETVERRWRCLFNPYDGSGVWCPYYRALGSLDQDRHDERERKQAKQEAA